MAVSTITGFLFLTAVLGFVAVVLAAVVLGFAAVGLAAVVPFFAATPFTGLALDFLLGEGLRVS